MKVNLFQIKTKHKNVNQSNRNHQASCMNLKINCELEIKTIFI